MEDIITAFKILLASIFFTIVNTVKAFLPNGVLPRKDVTGKRVLITGSGSGIGRLMAIEFAKLGAELILWDINEQGLNETAQLVEKTGGKSHKYVIDLSKYQEIHRVADQTKADVGEVDILINNAGIVTGKKLFDCPDELMEKTMAVNTNALFYTAKNFVPSMLKNDSGHVVTIASMAGKTGCAGLVDYCASKHGAVGCHDSLAMEILSQKKYGVKNTLVCPFYINTGMFHGAATKWPTLLPILEPDYVVDCIMEAILTNRPLLCMPRACYIVMAFMGILPLEVQVLMADYFGINESMNDFKGRQKSD